MGVHKLRREKKLDERWCFSLMSKLLLTIDYHCIMCVRKRKTFSPMIQNTTPSKHSKILTMNSTNQEKVLPTSQLVSKYHHKSTVIICICMLCLFGFLEKVFVLVFSTSKSFIHAGHSSLLEQKAKGQFAFNYYYLISPRLDFLGGVPY